MLLVLAVALDNPVQVLCLLQLLALSVAEDSVADSAVAAVDSAEAVASAV